ncbi:LAFE_0H06722g1_1 [Lachancea fermentati]|uniref:LAFE_0H06722g1_1 n=1 Tax=Lachancea fermentati TaxID=4955 RepID=A0A1G4MJT9_LACFM|nr:LAFE_0H06722g1_1 [Lachancea fermentati]
MSRVARRGKGPKDQNQADELAHESSTILASVLKTLDLTLERDIGMLNGKHVRSIPSENSLVSLQDCIEKLDKTLERISKSDEDTVKGIEEIIEARKEAARSAATITETPTTAPPQEKSTELPSDEDTSVVHKRQTNRKRSLKMEDEDDEDVNVNRLQKTENFETSDGHIEKKSKSEVERIENDPSVKNPKSEFVVSQTLPAAAISLGLFTEKGLESTGEDFFKKKYGVASYPTNDLKDLLPGEIPDMDFSRPKPTNQIQYSTFLTSVDNFFRDFSDDDIKFLKQKYLIPPNIQVEKTYDPEVTPYVIPKLGPLYTELWAKEDNNQNIANLSPPPINDPSSILPKKSGNDISDEVLDTEEVSCGPFVSRLLSAILRDEIAQPANDNVKEENDDQLLDEEAKSITPAATVIATTPLSEVDDIKTLAATSTSAIPQQQGWKVNSINLDYPTFEERLKRELKYVGIYMNLPKDDDAHSNGDPDWLTGREDDEISAELRELQNDLRQVTKRNLKRKTVLIPLVERQLAWQEYSSILEDLDKQVDQAYIKRIRVPKNKKKKQQATASTGSTSQAAIQAAHQQAANSSLKSLLDKRRRWISKIGPLFDKPEIMKRIPKESVFRDLDQEEEEEEADVFGSNGSNKDDELTDSLQNKE